MLSTALLSLVAASSLGTQPPEKRVTICGGPYAFAHIYMRLENPWTFDPGDLEIIEAPALAIAAAIASEMRVEMGDGAYGYCIPDNTYDVTDSDSDIDAEDRLNRSVSAFAAASVLPPNADGVIATAEARVYSGIYDGTAYAETNSGSEGGSIYWSNLFDPNLPYCNYAYDWSVVATATAVAANGLEWDLDNPTGPELPTFLPELHLDLVVDIGINSIMPDCTRGTPPAPDAQSILWFTATLTVTRQDTTTTTYTEQGVIGALTNGTLGRLGVLADNAFEPIESGDDLSIDADVPLFGNASFTDVASISYTMLADGFSGFDGDLDRDGDLDWCDRRLMTQLSGATVGTAAYNARADFDLDGTIEPSDLAAFYDVWDAAVIALTTCPGDFNCDGVTNSTDVSDFTNQWYDDQTNSTSETDYDQNGVINSTDVSSFINDWYTSC